MKLLAEVILFAIPMVLLAWTLPKKYVLLSQIVITGLFIGYQSPLSFVILTYHHIWKLLFASQSSFTKVHKNRDQPLYFNPADRVSKNFVYHT